MTQKDTFLDSEGNEYYRRNKQKLTSVEYMMANDRVVNSLKQLPFRAQSVLEVGCSNGWRLEALRRMHGTVRCFGLDPSTDAVNDGKALFPEISLQTGTADKLPYGNDSFDLLIFGFCLYFCDRADLFRIVSEADRVLQNRGYLVVLDFDPPFAYRNEYKHRAGIYAYKMSYPDAFLWNPTYTLVSQVVFAHQDQADFTNPDERVAVTILRKSSEGAFPDNPFV